MSLTWLLLILAVALFVLGAMRFDLIAARWRELMGRPRNAGDVPPAGPLTEEVPPNTGLHPHTAPAHKPDFHRSGRRH